MRPMLTTGTIKANRSSLPIDYLKLLEAHYLTTSPRITSFLIPENRRLLTQPLEDVQHLPEITQTIENRPISARPNLRHKGMHLPEPHKA